MEMKRLTTMEKISVLILLFISNKMYINQHSKMFQIISMVI